MTLSVIIIAKNAEEQIADAIESIRGISDEIIVVDNGSKDRTVEIVRYLKAKVVSDDKKDFSHLRNVGLRESRGEWVLYVDADERATKELISSIKYQVSSGKKSFHSAFRIRRKNFYLDNHEWPYIEKIERLFKRDKIKGWKGQLHESAIYEGEAGELEGFLMHYTHRDLSSMLEKTIEWSEVEAKLRFDVRHPRMTWWRFPRVMIGAFFESYIKQGGWKAGTAGLIESIYQAFSMFITYARLWEMQQKLKS